VKLAPRRLTTLCSVRKLNGSPNRFINFGFVQSPGAV
jgi:hypothetical protein